MIRKLWRWVLDLLYPPKCVLCQRLLQPAERDLCAQCAGSLLINTAPVKGIPLCKQCIAPLNYQDAIRESLLRFKFSGKQNYAVFYGTQIADAVKAAGGDAAELITWVPISKKRLRERGFDQAQLLAQTVAAQLGLRAVKTLKKIRNNRRQSGLKDAAERRGNVRGAYRIYRPQRVRGKHVLLVDDIVTTGATLSECTAVLLAAGAADVCCAAAATAHKTN